MNNEMLSVYPTHMGGFFGRITFVLLSTIVCVFFSEKMYWYPQGYAILEPILFYAVPVYTVIWAIAYFRVQSVAGIVLIASLYAFLIEGVLTPVLFEGGLLDPFLPAYFVGWHGVLAMLFGWFYVRKLLLAGAWRKLSVAAVCVGIFWGAWSTGYWLPEQSADWTHLAVNGTTLDLQWPVWKFGLHACSFTLMLIAAHWGLEKVSYPSHFTPTRWEKWGVFILLGFFFATLSFPAAPLGIVKLALLSAVILLPLALCRQRQADSVLVQLQGKTNWSHLLTLLWMPVAAIFIYAFFSAWQPALETLRALNELITIGQWMLGAAIFLWAIVCHLQHCLFRIQ